MDRGQIDWDGAAGFGSSLRSAIDPNDVDGIKNRLIDQIHWQALRRQLPRSGRLLDVGCGVGRMAQRVCTRGLDYTGADISRKMIETAKAANEKTSAKFVHLAERPMPFDEAEFDLILTVMVYQYVVGGPDNASFVDELRRVIRRGGRLIMIEQGSLSGQRSGTVSRTTTPDDYVRALSPHFRVDQIKRIRSSEFSRATHRLFSVAKRSTIAKRIVVPIATAIEYHGTRWRGEAYFRSVPYFDILISATAVN
ncbi:class I SAM-dependent methyltransferase [Bradyrhizobium canariense]|uniref:Methyltransferase domain-containing protein n=1 Tax=Bradyrhizobium canariense TaxID=255045 RepID=A0A1H2BMS8_9BRAD|nr:class I SAM-dependent methyltransferase [Bradyrhizobium canariense]SDT59640.1 Methyltransferase domain-containing protein [Bradyrhizobium canariense]